MAYTKQTWENLPSQTTPINADRLTHIEDGIFNAAATADTAASDASSAISGLADKVDKVEGKGLSTNDFTDALKTKLDNVEAGAEVNVQSDWNEADSSSDAFILNKPTLGTSAYKNSTSVVTDSTDLVESGAVYNAIKGQEQLLDDTVGWISDEQAKLYDWTGSGAGITFTYTKEQLTVNGTATGDTSQPSSGAVPEDGKYTLKAGTYKIECDVNDVYWEVLSLNPIAFITQNSKSFTITEDKTVFIRANIKNGTSFNNQKVHVSLRKLSVDETKADNSVIAPTENGATASQAYAVGSHAIRNGAFITWKNAKAQGETINDASDYTSGQVGDIVYLTLNKSVTINAGSNTNADFGADIPFNNYDILGVTTQIGGTNAYKSIVTWLASGQDNLRINIQNTDASNQTWSLNVYVILRVK